ncbi:hypothetical protein [Stenotrophomonas maltophilia]|uniref:hypothetical protein n=1 Tax=Stenotrophomonas maltophilia TaxID=40324 RepID=UPI001F46EAF2|nr:hypothetical protein [Stenotrophomonas maltophilia]
MAKGQVKKIRLAYASLVDRVFGDGSAVFDTVADISNNVIGAIAHPTQFDAFKSNFEARLLRLRVAADRDPALRTEILGAVNRVASREWDGAYAELCALDYFLAGWEMEPGTVVLDRTVRSSETLASEMGMTDANHDLSFTKLGVSADTKVLSDKSGQILEGIFKSYRGAKKIQALSILPEYDPAADYSQFSDNRADLLKELIDNVDPDLRPRHLKSKVIEGLSYSFGWDPGVQFACSTYCPREHAKQQHRLLFQHAKKFSRNEASVIVFVIFPWFSQKVYQFKDATQTFLKEFADNFFHGYIGSSIPVLDFNAKFKSSISVEDVTRHLSGVVYLQDSTIYPCNLDELGIEASYAWNPNARHLLKGHEFEARLNRKGAFDLSTFDPERKSER